MYCPTHNKELKLVKAGVSKRTGKPYKAFLACPVYECKYTEPAGTQEGTQEIKYTEPEGEEKILDKLDALHKMLVIIDKKITDLADI